MSNQSILSQIETILDNIKESSVLLAVRELVDAKFEDVKQIELEKFRAHALELQRNYGIDAEELTSSLSNNRGKGLRVKDKYRSKTNPRDSWSGRGKQPNWINAYLAENPNHKLEDLLTEKPETTKTDEPKAQASSPAKPSEPQKTQQGSPNKADEPKTTPVVKK